MAKRKKAKKPATPRRSQSRNKKATTDSAAKDLDDPKKALSEEIDDELAVEAMQLRRQGKPIPRKNQQALARVEKREEEKTRRRIYRTIPLKHWREMSGRQNRQLYDQAAKYGLPFDRAEIDLFELVPKLHAFLADISTTWGKDPEGILGGPETDNLDRLRLAQAIKVEMDNEQTRGVLRRVDEVHKCFAQIAHVWRQAAISLRDEFGDEAQRILEDALNEGQTMLDSLLPEVEE